MEVNATLQTRVTLHITLSQQETQTGTRHGHAAIDTLKILNPCYSNGHWVQLHWNELVRFRNVLIVLTDTFFRNNQEIGGNGQSNLQELHINVCTYNREVGYVTPFTIKILARK